jgi:hypothetical protein
MLAAAYVEDAKLERGGYGKFQYHFKPRHAQIAFRILTSHPFQILIYFNVILHASLTFFEPPSVSMYLKDSIAVIILNFVCLVLYTVDVFLIVLFLSFKTFLKSSDCIRAKVELILLCLFAIDWLLLVIQVAVFEATGNQAVGYIVQPFRCLRLAMIVCKSRNVAHVLAVMLSITVKLGKLMFVMLVYILIFSSIGTHLLMPHYSASNGSRLLEQLTANVCLSAYSNVSTHTSESPLSPMDTYSSRYRDGFHNIGIAAVNLFVLFTTENYPGFIFPSYASSPASWLFFGIFISIGVFLLAPLLLAVIADLYWEYNKKHVKKERTKQRKLLIEAWNLLDSGDKEYLPVDSPNLCKLFRILKPKNSEEENKELLNYLDPDESGYIDWVQWVTELLFVLDLEKSKPSKEDGKKVSSSCSTAVSDFCERLTTWKHFNRAVLVFIIIYCLLFVLTWEGIEPVVELVIQLLRTAIVVLFCVEILLRIVGAGRGIVRKKQEIIEMCLVVLGFCSNVVWYGWYALDSRAEGYVLRAYYWKGSCTVLSSLFIFTRLLFNSAQTKRALQLLLHLFPVIWDLLILFMIVVYTYAVVGMESFRHIPIQQPVDHCYEHYKYGCGVGFVDFKCSLLMVFQIITTNNWHDIMYGVIQNAQTYAPVVYFIPCFIIINLLLMNLLISIGLEAVNYFTKRTDQLELDSEEKEDNNEEAAVRKGSGNLGAKQHVRFQLKDQVWECLKTLKVYFGAAFKSARSDPEEMDLSFSPQHSTHPSRIQSGKLLSRTNTRRGRRNVEMELALLRLPIPECTTPDPSLDDIEVCSDTDLSDISEQSAQEAGRYTDVASQRKVRASSESDNSETYQQGVTNGGKSRRRLFSTAHAIRSLNRTRKISTDSSGSSKRKNSIEESDKERSQLMKGRFHVRKKVNWRTEIQDMTLINSSEFQELRERLREASVEVKQSNVGELGVVSDEVFELYCNFVGQ